MKIDLSESNVKIATAFVLMAIAYFLVFFLLRG